MANGKKASEAVVTDEARLAWPTKDWLAAAEDRPVGPTVLFLMDKSVAKTTLASAFIEAVRRRLDAGHQTPIRVFEVEAENRLAPLYKDSFDCTFEATRGDRDDHFWFSTFWTEVIYKGYMVADAGSNTWLRLKEDAEKLAEDPEEPAGSGMIIVLPVRATLDAIDTLSRTYGELQKVLPKAAVYVVRVNLGESFDALSPAIKGPLDAVERLVGPERCLSVAICPEVPPGGFCRPFSHYATRAAEIYGVAQIEASKPRALLAPGMTPEKRRELLARGDLAVRVQNWAEDVIKAMDRVASDYDEICKSIRVQDYPVARQKQVLAAE
jgi:hypothetical protein